MFIFTKEVKHVAKTKYIFQHIDQLPITATTFQSDDIILDINSNHSKTPVSAWKENHTQFDLPICGDMWL